MTETVSYEARPFEANPPLPGAWLALAEAIGALLPNDGPRLPDAMRRALESLYGDKAPDLVQEPHNGTQRFAWLSGFRDGRRGITCGFSAQSPAYREGVAAGSKALSAADIAALGDTPAVSVAGADILAGRRLFEAGQPQPAYVWPFLISRGWHGRKAEESSNG